MKKSASIFILGLFLLLLVNCPAFAIKMNGKVYDEKSKEPLEFVNIINVATQQVYITDSTGIFSIDVQSGQLIEFQKLGYKIARIRIPKLQTLPYYSLGMIIGAMELEDVLVKGRNRKVDSIVNYETYKSALEFYQLEGLDILQHPFDALSKRNRQIWAFQKHYDYFEKQKYIDYVFNDILISKLTSIDSTDYESFKRAYRPDYEQLKQWNEYEFFEYIKMAGEDFLMYKRRNRR